MNKLNGSTSNAYLMIGEDTADKDRKVYASDATIHGSAGWLILVGDAFHNLVVHKRKHRIPSFLNPPPPLPAPLHLVLLRPHPS
jgi:hypothetical protein